DLVAEAAEVGDFLEEDQLHGVTPGSLACVPVRVDGCARNSWLSERTKNNVPQARHIADETFDEIGPRRWRGPTSIRSGYRSTAAATGSARASRRRTADAGSAPWCR